MASLKTLDLISLGRTAASSGRARDAREAAGLSQADVAAHCGVTPGAVALWERGERKPQGATALRLGRLIEHLERRHGEVSADKSKP